MTTTPPDLFGNLLAQMPADARQRFHSGHGDPTRRTDTRETAEDAEARVRLAHEALAAQWRELTPAMYASASLTDLDADQDPGGRVSGWWEAGPRVLVLHGSVPGNGKTHSAYAVGHAANLAGAWCAAWTAADLNAALRPGNDETAYETAANCDLLIVDDLGREQSTDWTIEQLQRLLDARCRELRRLVVTTNLTGEELVRRYGDPIIDRLIDGADIIEYTGPSRRRAAG